MNTLAITIIVIFTTTLLVSYFKSTAKDRCLKDFRSFQTLVILKNNNSLWGRLIIESSGVVLEYPESYDNVTHLERGYIIYRGEFSILHGLFRIIDQLTAEELRLRERTSLVFERSWIVNIRRVLRNFFAAVRDAIVDTFSLFLGRITPKSAVVAGNQKYVKSVGESFIDYVGNSYDSILERLIGKRVIIEVSRDGKWTEYEGTMRNYTKDFVEVLSTYMPISYSVKCRRGTIEAFGVVFERIEDSVIVKNFRKESISLSLENAEATQIKPDCEKSISSAEEAIFDIEYECEVDAIFPRSEAIVRHPTVEFRRHR